MRESPNATLGFSTDMSRFQRFGCPGTVQVAHIKLYVRDDVSVSKTPPQSRIGHGRGGKVSRIKGLPSFYLRTGGGLTTNESHKMCDFGGWLVYCPALDNENFRGRGIMATRSVQSNQSNVKKYCTMCVTVAAEDGDVTYRDLTLKPNLSDPETDIMHQLYSKSTDQELTARQLELISTMQFVHTVADTIPGEPREEVKTLREAMRSEDWPI